MIASLTIALLGSAIAATAHDHAGSHTVRVEHHSGAMDTSYRGRLVVAQRQIGTAAPGNRQSTLRCAWHADVVVDRTARHASGSTLARSFTRERVMSGSRPGWCSTAQPQIDREVAARGGDLGAHLAAVAAEDRTILMAEADRLHGQATGG